MSIEKIFFNSSLPRSGSTLIQNLIGQNTAFYVTPTSGVLELLYGARANFTECPEFKAQDKELMSQGFKGFCKGGVEGFFNNITNKKYVVDKSRGWGINYPWTSEFYPEVKMFCMIRDLREIASSLEKKYRQNQLKADSIVNNSQMQGTTTFKRTQLFTSQIPLGLSLDRLADMITQGIDQKVLFIKYESFLKNPDSEMRRLYNFFNIPYFKHDFQKIDQITVEDDNVHGPYGDHKIHNTLLLEKANSSYQEVLGLHASDWIRKEYNWFFEYFGYE